MMDNENDSANRQRALPESYGELTDEHRAAIKARRTPLADAKIHHPTKNVEYVPWPVTAEALDEVFGIGGWRMQLFEAVETDYGRPELTWKGWLVAYGHPIWATGSGQLGHMGYSDAYQSAESRAMSKAAARLGIYRDAWLKEDAGAIAQEARPAPRRAPAKTGAPTRHRRGDTNGSISKELAGKRNAVIALLKSAVDKGTPWAIIDQQFNDAAPDSFDGARHQLRLPTMTEEMCDAIIDRFTVGLSAASGEPSEVEVDGAAPVPDPTPATP